jgi:NDP-sugar pyrophosphorylase family protein
LCGGLGTRLRPLVSDRPKALADIGGRPFLDLLVDELARNGLRRLVLCTGYGGEQIAGRYKSREDADFVLSNEDRPLGTGGAVIRALSLTRSDPVVIVNGDSFCRVNYADLLEFHRQRRALLTIVAVPPAGREDAGAICADRENKVIEFAEKPVGGIGRQVNAGIYVMQREAAELAPRRDTFSLEREFFPAVTGAGRCFVFSAAGPLIDIGTPERLLAAQEQLRAM